MQSHESVVVLANEEKYRIETPEEEEEVEEKKGLFKPLPTQEEPQYSDKDGRPQPIVRVLGFHMREKRKDLLMLILIPALVALIDTMIYSFVVTVTLPNNATYLFMIPIILAIPIGLTSSEAGHALVGAFLGAVFFLIFFVLFLAMPGIIVPALGLSSFLISGIALAAVYFILMMMATLVGSVIGLLLREFF